MPQAEGSLLGEGVPSLGFPLAAATCVSLGGTQWGSLFAKCVSPTCPLP